MKEVKAPNIEFIDKLVAGNAKASVLLPSPELFAPRIKKIETTEDLLLILFFDNGEIQSLDFKKEKLSGSLAPLANKEFFKKAYLSEYGMVEFPNDIQLDPIGLYEDSIAGDLRNAKLLHLKH